MTATLTKEVIENEEIPKHMKTVTLVLGGRPDKKGTTEVYEDGNVRLVIKYM